MTFEQFWNSHGHGYEHGGDMYRALKVCWDVSAMVARTAAMEEAAKVADYHNENHCENRDTTYRNCGSAIASGIRALARPVQTEER